MTFKGQLHGYQEPGRAALREWRCGLLSLPPGTGKTPTVVAVIEDLMDEGVIKEAGLFISLSGIKGQTLRAIEKFSDSKPLVISGNINQRRKQYELARNWYDEGIDYIVLNHEQIVNDWDEIETLPKGFIVIDEISKMRVLSTARTKQIKKLWSPIRYGLTATPMEGAKPEEAFSLMEWVDPTVFGDPRKFDRTFVVRDTYGRVIRYRNIPLFHERLRTRMYRVPRDDERIASVMPEVVPTLPIKATLTEASQELYDLIAGELLVELDAAAGSFGVAFDLNAHYGKVWKRQQATAAQGEITKRMLALQMLCNHPEQLRRSGEKYKATSGQKNQHGSAYAASLIDRGLLTPDLGTPKLDRMMRWLVKELENPKSKVIIFSFYTEMIDLIGEALTEADIGWVPFTGKQNDKKKDQNILQFRTNPKVRVFLSSDAGGYGVDLPEANVLLSYDLPSLAGTADQRETRHDRASSEFEKIQVRQIIVDSSIEELKWEQLVASRKVVTAFVDGVGYDAKGGLKLNVSTLTTFLRLRL